MTLIMLMNVGAACSLPHLWALSVYHLSLPLASSIASLLARWRRQLNTNDCDNYEPNSFLTHAGQLLCPFLFWSHAGIAVFCSDCLFRPHRRLGSRLVDLQAHGQASKETHVSLHVIAMHMDRDQLKVTGYLLWPNILLYAHLIFCGS